MTTQPSDWAYGKAFRECLKEYSHASVHTFIASVKLRARELDASGGEAGVKSPTPNGDSHDLCDQDGERGNHGLDDRDRRASVAASCGESIPADCGASGSGELGLSTRVPPARQVSSGAVHHLSGLATPRAAEAGDTERLDWIMRNVRGSELRRIGVHTNGGEARAAIDAAMGAVGAGG